MSIRYKGGILSATPPTLVAGAGASGAWTLEQQMQATAAGLWPVNGPFYVEDVFSTYLYTGNGSAQTINNGIDLSANGGLVWFKTRARASGDLYSGHFLYDSARGLSTTSYLMTNNTEAQGWVGALAPAPTFLSNGFTTPGPANNNTETEVAWTFRKQPKFFDVVTWTGNGSYPRTISHSLGSVPGCIICKQTSLASQWATYHTSLGNANAMYLNSTLASFATSFWNSTTPTSTDFTIGASFNAAGETYVAYLFAHDAGGFGLTGSDNVISCGSFTTDSSGNATVSLGYEVQWLTIKSVGTGAWYTTDIMRGMTNTVNNCLFPNTSNAETNIASSVFVPNSTGFTVANFVTDTTFIYIAIRRGPMKTPTVGTSVFAPVAYASTNVDNRLVNTGIVTDMTFDRTYDGSSTAGGTFVADRLRGDYFFGTAVTDAEAIDADSFMTPTVGCGNSFSAQNGFGVGNDVSRRLNYSTFNMVAYAFGRAPGFFDVVCYSGAASPNPYLVSHNLGVSPELIIIKARNNVTNWYVWGLPLGIPGAPAGHMFLNLTNASATTEDQVKSVSSTTFGLKPNENLTSGVGYTYVAYLFATLAGVSKVGSFTGTAALQTVNCGFTTGARFVMIKRTDSTSDWYVWNSARGITSGNDPYLRLNLGDIEDTATNYVDTDTTGFKVTAAASATVNASGGTYLFLAIA